MNNKPTINIPYSTTDNLILKYVNHQELRIIALMLNTLKQASDLRISLKM